MPGSSTPQQLLTKEQKERVIRAITSKNIRGCPLCGTNTWTVADGYFVQPLNINFNALALGGTSIPSIALVCSNCGFMSQHALGVLGLMPDEKKEGDSTSSVPLKGLVP